VGGRPVHARRSGIDVEAAEPAAFAPIAVGALLDPLDEAAFDLLPGEMIDNTNGMPFHAWGDDDGRINYGEFFGGFALYCIGASGAPDDTYRGGGMQILSPTGELLVFVPSGVILAGYQQMTQTGQDVLLGAGGGTALWATAGGAFRADATESTGKPIAFAFSGCRVVPKATSDNCPPSWDRDEHGNCVHRNLY
jgi:hypothetical protein